MGLGVYVQLEETKYVQSRPTPAVIKALCKSLPFVPSSFPYHTFYLINR